MRADGSPAADTVARVIAFTVGICALTASSNHRVNCSSGSGATSFSSRLSRMYSWRRSAMLIGEA